MRSYPVIRSGSASPNALNAAGCDPKSPNYFPKTSCRVSHFGYLPRPNEISNGCAGLRYFGKTAG